MHEFPLIMSDLFILLNRPVFVLDAHNCEELTSLIVNAYKQI